VPVLTIGILICSSNQDYGYKYSCKVTYFPPFPDLFSFFSCAFLPADRAISSATDKIHFTFSSKVSLRFFSAAFSFYEPATLGIHANILRDCAL